MREEGAGQVEWRGSVQHVTSGETRYFRDWPRLEAFVDGLLGRIESPAPQADAVEESSTGPQEA